MFLRYGYSDAGVTGVRNSVQGGVGIKGVLGEEGMLGVAAAVLGWLVLGEAVSPLQAVGGLIIIAGIWIGRPRPAQPGIATPGSAQSGTS